MNTGNISFGDTIRTESNMNKLETRVKQVYKADTKIMNSGINSVSHLPYIFQVSTHLTNHLPPLKRTSWYS